MEKFKPVKTAVIGCGAISATYLHNCVRRLKILDIVGCADIKPERSAARAAEYGIRQMTNEEIYEDPKIQLVINLTYPISHYEVSKAALLAGKHVYSEKMIAPTFEQGLELAAIAKEKNLLFGAAPDTFLGAGIQTARWILDSGMIGTPVAAEAILTRSYHAERSTDNPDRSFVYCYGGGLIFDVGCYYLTGIVNLLGAINRVCGFSQTREAAERVYMNPDNPDYGKVMKIDSPNSTAGTLEFKNGVLCPILTTSEGPNFTNSFVIYGTEGKLTINDPNEFTANVMVRTKNGNDIVMPQNHGFTDNYRGIGVADLAYALRNNRKPRASWEIPLHTLEAACGIVKSGENDIIYRMTTDCERSAPLAPGYVEYPEMVFDL